MRTAIALALVCAGSAVADVRAQTVVPQSRGSAQTPAPNRPRAVQVMPLSGPWTDGGTIPAKYTQAGDEVSPALTWGPAPEGVSSFVLVVRDLDALAGPGQEDVLHWLVWNIPPTATGLPEGVPQGPVRADGSRQISVSGPYYRGPGAPADGPPHHYVFELYALDTTLAVPPTGLSPTETHAAVRSAMAGHVRGKGVFIGLYRRSP
jgi:Raf kinase inhibitor-like YbhB/YbcL family protein